MASDNGHAPAQGQFMFVLTAEEVSEMRLALAARSRMNGHGTKANIICGSILKKIEESEKAPHVNGVNVERKVAGVDSTKWKEY